MKQLRLITLGRLALLAGEGETARPVAVRPRHLAVLAVLALSPRAVGRETLAELFWGDEPEVNARHSLSNALSALRSVLGAESISSYRETVAIAADVAMTVDAAEFEVACERGDAARAVALYGGPFLDHTPAVGSRTFEEWLDQHRARFERQFVASCERVGPDLLRCAEYERAASVAERWLRAAPRSTLALGTLVRARAATGSPSELHAALVEFERARRWLHDEYAIEPDVSVCTEIAQLGERLKVAEREALAAADVPRAKRAWPTRRRPTWSCLMRPLRSALHSLRRELQPE